MNDTLDVVVPSLFTTAVTFLQENRLKLIKYCGVAAIGVPVGLFVYWLCLGYWGEERGALANFVATLIMVAPNYLMNRYWVWEKNDANRFWGEVFPFAVMALIGLGVSTVAAGIASSLGAPTLLLLLVNLVSFGTVWVAKFFVLDKVLFGRAAATQ